MFRLFNFTRRPDNSPAMFSPEPDRLALNHAGVSGHRGLVAPLVDAAAVTVNPDTALAIERALTRLTGESFGGDYESVPRWYGWMGSHPEVSPAPGYDIWKGALYSQFDLNLQGFIYQGVASRIPLWAIQWGGVGPRDIPALDSPTTLPGHLQDFLDSEEPVVGVAVEGHARAYPVRILNLHEVVNDAIGPRAVTVVY
ncbi:MAG: DUF3179 domain-containing protein [Chloroflexi bacterium]|nr:DUF3179 domain-containing protein [Chloroflexota bacterium]